MKLSEALETAQAVDGRIRWSEEFHADVLQQVRDLERRASGPMDPASAMMLVKYPQLEKQLGHQKGEIDRLQKAVAHYKQLAFGRWDNYMKLHAARKEARQRLKQTKAAIRWVMKSLFTDDASLGRMKTLVEEKFSITLEDDDYDPTDVPEEPGEAPSATES